MTQPAYPLLAPLQVQTQPLPMQVSVNAVMMGGQRVVVMQVVTPQGVATYFMDEELAKSVASNITGAVSPIIIAPAGALR